MNHLRGGGNSWGNHQSWCEIYPPPQVSWSHLWLHVTPCCSWFNQLPFSVLHRDCCFDVNADKLRTIYAATEPGRITISSGELGNVCYLYASGKVASFNQITMLNHACAWNRIMNWVEKNHHKYMYECIHILELLSLKIVSWEPEGW